MSITISAPRAASRTDDTRPIDSAPAVFDPAAHPILARHFFGIEPFRPIGQVTEIVADLRFHRQVDGEKAA